MWKEATSGAYEAYQQEYFRRGLSQPRGSRANIMARMLEKNPKFIRESIYAEQLDGQARKILRGYAVGRLLVPGDNRFLSGDLLELLRQLIAPRVFQLPGERDFCNQVMGDFFAEDSFFAPGAAYDHEDSCTLLRNPHIARNEELQLSVYPGETHCASITWATSPMWSWCLQTVWRRSGWAEPTTTATSSRPLLIPF